MLTDIQIAQQNAQSPISDIAAKAGIAAGGIERYGEYKAKLTFAELKRLRTAAADKKGKLILVTAITPTPAGEGKTTVSIGLADSLSRAGKRTMLALREPSLGPCFGVKGGACGGGYAQIVPMEDINLHFTGDIHAISIATNLIAALIDNHLQQGNEKEIDPRTIMWRRCVDLNDRALRNIVIGLGGKMEGVPREDHFTIAVASEIMAIVCLASSISDLKRRISNIVIGENTRKEYVRFGDLGASGAIAAVLKDALRPNLVQTLEHTPAFVHGGPFANIAHGCNSVNATLSALALADYVVTEAGFAADLGAEKFLDIKCRAAGIQPSCAVVVATIRALKMHGGIAKDALAASDPAAVERGFANLAVHLENLAGFGVPIVVAVNRFVTDSDAEITVLKKLCAAQGATAVLCECWEKGSAGGENLAAAVETACQNAGTSRFRLLYEDNAPLIAKIETIATNIYRAARVDCSPAAAQKLARFTAAGYGKLPVCIAKTQNSISHDKTLVGAPAGYTFPVTDVRLYAGAGFVVALAGDIMTMPGLPKTPAALNIDVDDDGIISGLF